MSMIYRGSFGVVKSPEIRTPNRSLDYGSGFYTTTSYEQAKRLVERRMKDKGMAVGYVNVTQDNLYLLLPLKIGWLENGWWKTVVSVSQKPSTVSIVQSYTRNYQLKAPNTGTWDR